MKKILITMLVSTLCSGILLTSPEIACASDDKPSVASLREGRALLKKGRYGEAVLKLASAYQELPVIGDYALYFMADACSREKLFNDSNKFIDLLLRDYPDSLLKKKVRALKIRNTLAKKDAPSQEDPEDNSLRPMEQYLHDYPEDMEMTFLHGRLLKTNGDRVKAAQIFKRVYIANNAYSEAAFNELLPADLTADDMLAKSSNLIKAMEYKKAEALLRKILSNSDNMLKGEARKKLGDSLFKQKRYREAAEEFLKVGDSYNASRALYRAGEFDSFARTVSKLVAMDDSRAGSLLDALASKKRREGRTEEALQIYGDLKSRYPSRAEETTWGIAWTYYRASDYKKAAEVLTGLYKKSPNSKYLYWKTRSIENMAGGNKDENSEADTVSLEQPVNYPDKDFYGLLSQIKGSLTGLQLTDIRMPLIHNDSCDKKAAGRMKGAEDLVSARRQHYQKLSNTLERFGILMELGMKEDAAAELVNAYQKTTDHRMQLYIIYKLQEAGAYRRAINLITQIAPGTSRKHDPGEAPEAVLSDILYPFAYWPVVSEVSLQYNIDPFALLAVMREESRYDPEARSVSGALGLMQLMPQTAYSLNREAKVHIADKSMIHDVRVNITIGGYYLKTLLTEFKNLPIALAAYNAGHEKVRDWLRDGKYKAYDEFIEDIPFDETRNYVKKVLISYNIYRQQAEKTECLARNIPEKKSGITLNKSDFAGAH